MLPNRWQQPTTSISPIRLHHQSTCLPWMPHSNHYRGRDWHFGFETSRFRNFCQFFEGETHFGEFGLEKKSRSQKIWSRFWFRRIWSKKSISFCFGKLGLGKEKNQNNKKKTRPSKQCKFLIWILIFFVLFLPITYMEESKDCYVAKEKEETIWRRSLQKLSRILRSPSFSLGLETFANFCSVSVSVLENLVWGKKSRFWFWKIGSRFRRIWSW